MAQLFGHHPTTSLFQPHHKQYCDKYLSSYDTAADLPPAAPVLLGQPWKGTRSGTAVIALKYGDGRLFSEKI
jgi:hypothetical protein